MKEFRKNIYRLRIEEVIPPLDCKLADVTISSIAAESSDDGTVWLTYMACDGTPTDFQYADAGFFPNSVCVNPETTEAFYYYVGGEAINAEGCDLEITTTDC